MHSHPLNTIASLSITKSQTYSWELSQASTKEQAAGHLRLSLLAAQSIKATQLASFITLNHCNTRTYVDRHLPLATWRHPHSSQSLLLYNKPVKAPPLLVQYGKIALGHGLEPNTALGFTSCCISVSPTPSCYFFHIALAAVL